MASTKERKEQGPGAPAPAVPIPNPVDALWMELLEKRVLVMKAGDGEEVQLSLRHHRVFLHRHGWNNCGCSLCLLNRAESVADRERFGSRVVIDLLGAWGLSMEGQARAMIACILSGHNLHYTQCATFICSKPERGKAG